MPSLRSRLFLLLLEHRHLLRGKANARRAVTADTSIHALRARAARSMRLFGKLPKDVTAEAVAIGGRDALWLRPAGADPARVLLYFHGGGYVMGDCRSYAAIAAKFARGSRTNTLVFDYRLAPEHPFPAAVDDAVAAHDWLRGHGVAARNMVFAGDSAGGGLALATMLALKGAGGDLPAAGVVLSPWTDLSCSGASYARNLARERLAPPGSWTTFAAHYLGDCAPRHPLASPLFGDLAGLPPLLIHVGGDEVMRDDAAMFAEHAQRAGVEVTLRVGQGLFHCYPVCAPLFPEASAALAECCAFIRAAIPRRR